MGCSIKMMHYNFDHFSFSFLFQFSIYTVTNWSHSKFLNRTLGHTLQIQPAVPGLFIFNTFNCFRGIACYHPDMPEGAQRLKVSTCIRQSTPVYFTTITYSAVYGHSIIQSKMKFRGSGGPNPKNFTIFAISKLKMSLNWC